MPSPRRDSVTATHINHDGPNATGQRNGYGPAYPPSDAKSDIALALGCRPVNKNNKMYLTARQFVAYGIAERKPGQSKVTVADVLQAISELSLEPHGIRDGEATYDPIPIRKALTSTWRP